MIQFYQSQTVYITNIHNPFQQQLSLLIMQLPDWGEPRTPVKSRSHNTGHDDLKMILSQQKPKGRDLFQEIYEETLQPDMALFSGAKNEVFEEVEEDEQSQEDEEPSEKESSQPDKEQKKWMTVRKPFESAIDEKHRHGQSSTARTLKGCNCDKSKCQKNYCICFKMGNVCSDDCECLECQNTHITSTLLENERLSLEFLSNQNKGCNCKSSNCMKNYCICHQMGRKCSDICRCQNCLNFDIKDRDFDGMSGKKKVKISEFSMDQKENVRINW